MQISGSSRFPLRRATRAGRRAFPNNPKLRFGTLNLQEPVRRSGEPRGAQRRAETANAFCIMPDSPPYSHGHSPAACPRFPGPSGAGCRRAAWGPRQSRRAPSQRPFPRRPCQMWKVACQRGAPNGGVAACGRRCSCRALRAPPRARRCVTASPAPRLGARTGGGRRHAHRIPAAACRALPARAVRQPYWPHKNSAFADDRTGNAPGPNARLAKLRFSPTVCATKRPRQSRPCPARPLCPGCPFRPPPARPAPTPRRRRPRRRRRRSWWRPATAASSWRRV